MNNDNINYVNHTIRLKKCIRRYWITLDILYLLQTYANILTKLIYDIYIVLRDLMTITP